MGKPIEQIAEAGYFRPEPDRTEDPRLAGQVRVVLLTFNCAHRLLTILQRLRQLGLSIIAVDNASSDDTVALLTSRPEIEVIALSADVGAAGRNRGAQRATTPYVLFCDDDGWWEPGGLTAAVAMLEAHPRLAVVNARILVGEQRRLDGISAEMADSPLADDAGIPRPGTAQFHGRRGPGPPLRLPCGRRLRLGVLHGR
jgi:glycosyltransferase involved in cell wall biosynthesis